MKNYEGKVIQFTGGLRTYIGRMDSLPHPNGENWYRIKDPCTLDVVPDGKGKSQIMISRIWGIDHLYKHYVDVRVPDDSIMEIVELEEDGGFFKAYKKELDKASVKNIIIPSTADVININHVPQ
ncbi:MAG: hypothetical protein A2Y66_01850 [Nitrospirae bacterium RBG_13_41_22]|nr:MAG: hypothetical protein A2Y66_01850 [Nitrospirae bacterium RBG_13_41_22]